MFLHLQTRSKLVNSALILLFYVLLCSLFCACTPTFNWRQVQLDIANGSSLKAALPCKPDNATRKQQLGDIQVELSMMGCVANETTFTLSRIPLANPLDAPKVLTAWQTAAVANVGVNAGDKQVGGKPVPLTAANVSGAGAWPPAVSVTLNGAATQAHMLWFAKQTATGVTLYQAALYGKQPSNEAITTFFESLQLQ
ncbi:MAG: hypothetical protein RL761_705 [Pseudomonadota bacterium]|jgi:hypothetical protein